MLHPNFSAKRSSPLLLAGMLASGLFLAGCDEHVDVVRDHSVAIPKHATWAWRPAAANPRDDESSERGLTRDRDRNRYEDRDRHQDRDRDEDRDVNRPPSDHRDRDDDRSRNDDRDRDRRDDRGVVSRDVISSDGAHETISRDNHFDNETLRLELRTDIEQTLASKGFRQVSDPQSADFLVDYHFAIRRHTATVMRPYYGGYPGLVCGPFGCWESYRWGYWGPRGYGYENIHYREGTIVFDFVRNGSNKIAFRAVGRKQMNHSAFSADHVRDAVHRLLRDLKPGKN
jgi:hypothetical protein